MFVAQKTLSTKQPFTSSVLRETLKFTAWI